jgi:hypothetical protein
MIRSATLAPLIVSGRTDKPTGVRRLEELAPELIPALRKTVAAPDRPSSRTSRISASRTRVTSRPRLDCPPT